MSTRNAGDMPVQLKVPLWVGLRRHRPGSTVWLPAPRAIWMEQNGRGTVLLPSLNYTTGQMHHPLRPAPAPARTWEG